LWPPCDCLTIIRRPPRPPRFPYTTLFRSQQGAELRRIDRSRSRYLEACTMQPLVQDAVTVAVEPEHLEPIASLVDEGEQGATLGDRKSTRLNSSHVKISYAVFCLKKKSNE